MLKQWPPVTAMGRAKGAKAPTESGSAIRVSVCLKPRDGDRLGQGHRSLELCLVLGSPEFQLQASSIWPPGLCQWGMQTFLCW